MPNRLLVANDLPGIGKVALAASIPLLASCQVEVAILPTLILSSHTGGFPSVYVEDYGRATVDFLYQWRQIDLPLSGILVGYCRSRESLEQFVDFALERSVPLIVDPILGDHGRLYSGFDEQYVQALRQLCRSSAVLIPNLTEAAFLTETPYLGENYTPAEVEAVLHRLADLSDADIFVTGISFDSDTIGVAHRAKESGKVSYYMSRRFLQHFFGTGDMISALIAAAYVEKLDFALALPRILAFMEECLETTVSLEREVAYGVYFEPHLAKWSDCFRELKNRRII